MIVKLFLSARDWHIKVCLEGWLISLIHAHVYYHIILYGAYSYSYYEFYIMFTFSVCISHQVPVKSKTVPIIEERYN